MRSIESHWLVRTKLVVIALFVLAFPASARAYRWPEYGGTLRVELHALTLSLDPREWRIGTPEFATNEKFAALVFDRLISLDNYGRFIPQLATEWSHDASLRRWQFTLRAGVKFSDGAPLTAADAAAALAPLLPEGLQVSASGNSVIFQSSESRPDLLELLASGRFFISAPHQMVRLSAQARSRSTKSPKAPGPRPIRPQRHNRQRNIFTF